MTADERLREWSTWCRSGDPMRFGPNTEWPDGPPLPLPIYDMYRSTAAWDPAWGDYDAAPEVLPVPISVRRAEETDRLIMRLPVAHVLTVKRFYYNRKRCLWEDVYAAKRALQDLLDIMEAIAA